MMFVRANTSKKPVFLCVTFILSFLFGRAFLSSRSSPMAMPYRSTCTSHATRFPSCGACQKPCSTTHEYCERVVRDLPILGRAVRLSVLLRRVGCRDCGKRMEAVSWLDRYARMTRRLAYAVIQACERLPTLHVAQMFGLHWDTSSATGASGLAGDVEQAAEGTTTTPGDGRVCFVQRSSLRQRRVGRRHPTSVVDRRRPQPGGGQVILRRAGGIRLRSNRIDGDGDGHKHRV